MKKHIVRLEKERGVWVASIYDPKGGTFSWPRFFWYNKKQVIAKLRSEGVSVSHIFY